MLLRRGILILMLFPLALSARGQSFFAPEVIVNAEGLSESAQREMQNLQEYLELVLVNYLPSINVDYSPKQPIRIVNIFYVDDAVGDQYKGSFDMALYRPRFGRDKESLLVLLHEENISFRYQSKQKGQALVNIGFPEIPIARKIFYYATLGAMYYYDSFALYGGTPFLNYLHDKQRLFDLAWSADDASESDRSFLYAPSRHIGELRSEGGERFRELWYLYHREALDSEVGSTYGDTVQVVLSALRRLKETDSSLSFYSLFSISKVLDLTDYIQSNNTSRALEVRRLAEDLFPSIVF